jgi:hypothetical protein
MKGPIDMAYTRIVEIIRGVQQKIVDIMVFAVQFMSFPGITHGLILFSAPRNRVSGFIGNEADIPTLEVYNLLREGDRRRAATFHTSLERNGVTYKFPFPFFYRYFDLGNINSTNMWKTN